MSLEDGKKQLLSPGEIYRKMDKGVIVFWFQWKRDELVEKGFSDARVYRVDSSAGGVGLALRFGERQMSYGEGSVTQWSEVEFMVPSSVGKVDPAAIEVHVGTVAARSDIEVIDQNGDQRQVIVGGKRWKVRNVIGNEDFSDKPVERTMIGFDFVMEVRDGEGREINPAAPIPRDRTYTPVPPIEIKRRS